MVVHVERGQLAPACSGWIDGFEESGQSVGAVPFLWMFFTAQIARSDLDGAMASAHSMTTLAHNESGMIGAWLKAICGGRALWRRRCGPRGLRRSRQRWSGSIV